MERRWSARECHDYFEQDRRWELVLSFYRLVVSGQATLSDLRKNDSLVEERPSEVLEEIGTGEISTNRAWKGPRWERRTFKLVVSYSGADFQGWQKQPGLLTVQSVIEKQLGKFVDGKRARLLEAQGKVKEALVSVAGRTDKGVHAVGQVCSFYTWMKDVKPEDVEAAVNSAMPGSLRVVSAAEVDRDFHPIFSAKWRRYIYLLPLRDTELFEVSRVSKLLQSLEGQCLSYAVFARDTKAVRSSGPATLCTVFHARAFTVELPQASRAMVVELVADRFLRKMVRVLVSTAVREAAAGADDNQLVCIMDQASSRRDSAPPAPAQGLCLAEVGYV